MRGGNNDYRVMRQAVIKRLGGKCTCCATDDRDVLQIDHIAGGGFKERQGRNFRGRRVNSVNSTYWRRVLNDPLIGDRFQVLCANCHMKKTRANCEYVARRAISEVCLPLFDLG